MKEVIRYEPPSVANPYAQNNLRPKVPPEMELLWAWEKYGTPPVNGGILDQPFILLICFNIIHSERGEWSRVQKANKLAQLKWDNRQKGDG